jgi:hypothetical protein
MTLPDYNTWDLGRVADLLAPDDSSISWTPKELATLWAEQLAEPTERTFRQLQPNQVREADKLLQAHPDLKTFRDLLHDSKVPTHLLKLAKEYARQLRDEPDAPAPSAIATALYFALIASAGSSRTDSVTTLNDTQLVSGLIWLTQQRWIDDETLAMANTCLGRHSK